MKRFQARASRGRFTRNTPENTLGLHIGVCPGRGARCGRLLPVAVGEATPEFCENHAHKLCAHGWADYCPHDCAPEDFT